MMQPVRTVMRMTMSQGGGGTTTRGGDTANRPGTPPMKEVDVVAWYADDIISPVGPESHGQLPGVIMQLDVDNSAVVYTATEVKKSVDQKELKEPKKGKVVTRQEYMKLMTDLMSNQMGGGRVMF